MAIPEGITAYTLVIDGPKTWVWNAMKGEKYSSDDIFCPLVSIGCLVNDKNVTLMDDYIFNTHKLLCRT